MRGCKNCKINKRGGGIKREKGAKGVNLGTKKEGGNYVKQ
jgi:hypothetical protein